MSDDAGPEPPEPPEPPDPPDQPEPPDQPDPPRRRSRRFLDPERVDTRTFLAWTTGGGPILLGYGAHRILTEPTSPTAWVVGLVAVLGGTALLVALFRYVRQTGKRDD